MPHVVLIGDSIFDNAAYTEGGPDVVSQLRGLLPPGWDATLLAVCTIYNGCFDDQAFQRVASTTLTVFNDAIIRVAIEHALPVIDLRSVCATRADYANPIEPSSVGGEKIARVIVGLVCGATTTAAATRIVTA